MDDSTLDGDAAIRFRDANGLWHAGRPTIVRIYKSFSGELFASWQIPSTALAGVLCEKAAQELCVNPSRCSYVVMDNHRNSNYLKKTKPIIIQSGQKDARLNLCWLVRFEPIVSMQLVIRSTTTEEDECGEWGWRYLRHWKHLVATRSVNGLAREWSGGDR